MDFPGGASGKESTLNLHLEIQEMHPRVGKNLGVGNGNPLPFFSPGKLYGQRSLVGYSPYGHKELTRMSTHVYVLHFTYFYFLLYALIWIFSINLSSLIFSCWKTILLELLILKITVFISYFSQFLNNIDFNALVNFPSFHPFCSSFSYHIAHRHFKSFSHNFQYLDHLDLDFQFYGLPWHAW